MSLLSKHWSRIAVTLIPLVFALLHALGVMPIGVLQRLDDIIYDARLRWTMPRTLDERIVIVDIDEKSLAEVGRWPWGRNRLAELVDELFERQKVALVGFDVVFAEPDDSSGLKQLRRLAQAELKDQPGFAERLNQLQGTLDYDAAFAKSLRQRPVVLGYYFTSDRDGRTSGLLPEPVMHKDALRGRPIKVTSWNGYGANIEQLAKAAPMSGFFNPIVDQRTAWCAPFRCWPSTRTGITNRCRWRCSGCWWACLRWSRAFRRSASCRATTRAWTPSGCGSGKRRLRSRWPKG